MFLRVFLTRTGIRFAGRRSSALLKGGGVVVLGVALALAAIETAMRVVGWGAVQTLAYGRGHYHPDLPEVGYAGRPNVSGIQSAEGVSRVAFNSHGFHDLEHDRAKPADAFRIVVIGNSYSVAEQVAREHGYVAKLAENLRGCPSLAGREVETINLGVDGFTIHQQFLMLRDYGLTFSPDMVLLQVNDFVVPGDLDPLKNFSPRLEQAEAGIIVNLSYLDTPDYREKSSNAANLLQQASDHSRLLQYLLQYRRARARTAAKPEAAPAVDEAAIYESYRRGRDLAFGEIASLVQAHDIRFAVTITPEADALSDRPLAPNPLRRDWMTLAQSVNAPLLDIEEEARAQVRRTGAWLHGFGAQTGTGHLNRAGNAVFAQALAPRICGLLGDTFAEAGPILRR
ncbi:hypothetical protein CCR94_12130 [Rhodoblastus sphagnicola]|uniref:SGNH hydrolase-type esterase domain-containing protein n=1 Tax=Rhodoblastus sphagnicola TaxID=333368 RepID=A0A2S6N7F6_9HYPH|nr:hypothetical protein [Rhodoblastus sphagnicola]MBB4196231.1 hypothetical protein [Rhodoblastus sphagnicola]PPQ30555.1 hypothetical protein CCR94_12130 [Rhodoblastus sphagnicola]